MNRLLACCAVLASLLAGCGTTGSSGAAAPKAAGSGNGPMAVSPLLPAAEGTASFGKGKNDNTTISVRVKHLAHPERLGARTYVVWTRRTKDAPPQNIGALDVDSGLNGSLDTVSALREFDLFVTTETSPQADKPGSPPLLWTSYSR